MIDVCNSGGALGADCAWATAAHAHDHEVRHHLFEHQRANRYVPEREIVRHLDADMDEAFEQVKAASKRLRRPVPDDEYSSGLLLRNWFQVKDSQSLYAVGWRDEQSNIQGGTAWAVEMFKRTVYCARMWFYCQDTYRWLHWDGRAWEGREMPPRPTGPYAAIGSRRLCPAGETAIREAYG